MDEVIVPPANNAGLIAGFGGHRGDHHDHLRSGEFFLSQENVLTASKNAEIATERTTVHTQGLMLQQMHQLAVQTQTQHGLTHLEIEKKAAEMLLLTERNFAAIREKAAENHGILKEMVREENLRTQALITHNEAARQATLIADLKAQLLSLGVVPAASIKA